VFSISTYFLLLVAGGTGLTGVAGLRIGGRLDRTGVGSCIFFACFAALALCTVGAMVCNNNAWCIFGAVLAAMAVGATLDLERHPSPSAC
jgi:hypothetical protein